MFFDVYQNLCLSLGKKPGTVARELGISSPSVTQWKRGSVPRPAVLKKIADYFKYNDGATECFAVCIAISKHNGILKEWPYRSTGI